MCENGREKHLTPVLQFTLARYFRSSDQEGLVLTLAFKVAHVLADYNETHCVGGATAS